MCFAHPLGNKALLAGLGTNPIMRDAVNAFDSQQLETQASERMIRISDRYRLALMMGSMLILRLAVRSKC